MFGVKEVGQGKDMMEEEVLEEWESIEVIQSRIVRIIRKGEMFVLGLVVGSILLFF